MLFSAQHGSKCIRCAYRARIQSLAARRWKSGTYRPLDAPNTRRDGRHTPPASDARRRDRDSSERAVRDRFRGRIDGFNNTARGKGEQFRRKPDWGQSLRTRLAAMKEELKDAPVLDFLRKEDLAADKETLSFGMIWKEFTSKLVSIRPDRPNQPSSVKGVGTVHAVDKGVLDDFRMAYRERGESGLDNRIKYHFYAHVTGSRFTENDIRNQKALADLRYPSEWFPATRQMHRTIHLHVGPTNSGKTYQALQRLEQAEKGIYAGPLRLLAHEVYSRLNAKGKPCNLVTGEERRLSKLDDGTGVFMSACTVEMVPFNSTIDVCVIDEIQMIGNMDRGWAWTAALMGVKAKEVHLCGEERTVPLIRELCASVGEKLHVHRYERLSPLQVADQSLNSDLKKLRKGDCVVSFSVMGIHALRRQIEKATGKKVATVYGSLPPETRAQQARLFNDPDNDYDFLVASDAVGMGLNLAIKRVIFETSSKFDGQQRRTLNVADIKQIGGRAGRYRVAPSATHKSPADEDLAAAKGDATPPAEKGTNASEAAATSNGEPDTLGLVTTLDKFDFPIVASAMVSEPEPITSAGLFPPAPILERFSSYFPPGTPFSYILTRLHELSQMHSRFHLCGLKDQVWVADLIEEVDGLTVLDRNAICAAPASRSDSDMWRTLMPKYARCIAEQSGGDITEIAELPLETLEEEPTATREYLRDLERLHKGIVTYLWLSYRFAGVFTTRALAFHVKGIVEGKIEEVLSKFSFSEQQRRQIAAKREKHIRLQAENLVAGGEGRIRDAVTSEDLRESPAAAEVGREDGHFAVEGLAEAEEVDAMVSASGGNAGDEVVGDRFSGEEDFPFEEPELLDSIEEAGNVHKGTNNFSAWSDQQRPGDGQGSHEEDDGLLMPSTMAGNSADQPSSAEPEPEHLTPRSQNAESPSSSVPPKHLHGLDVEDSRPEQSVVSRP